MKWSRARKIAVAFVVIGAIAATAYVFAERNVGVVIDRYKGVAIYDNGPLIAKSHGKHYSASGYYWGQRWQCVEFVKRFYDQAKGHQMPDVWGHAKDFFDPAVPQGGMNQRRALRQFRNGADVAPEPDDLFVFGGAYGHVGIVSEVSSNAVEIVQQNIYRKPRARFGLARTNGTFVVESKSLMGWLRK
jgi:surface antigen